MNKVAAFVRLDFYSIMPYKKSMLLLLALAVGMTLFFNSLSTMCAYLMMCLVLVMTYPFSIAETHRLDTLYATMALTRGDVVVGRYAFALCMEVLAALLALLMAWGISLFTDLEFVLDELLFMLCVVSFIFAVLVSIQYPIYFKLGYTRAKFIAYMPMLLLVAGVFIMQNIVSGAAAGINFEDVDRLLMGNKLLSYGVPLLAGHALLALSCALSLRLYTKRDI